MMVCSGMDSIAAPIEPPKTRNISAGLMYAPELPWEAWNME